MTRPFPTPWFGDAVEQRQVSLHTRLSMRVYAAGAGTVSLLLHGFPGSAWCWRRQLEPLSRSGRVVAPDLRGFGGSSAPCSWRHYRLRPHLVADVLALIDHLGIDRVHLVGHDLGGLIAWQLAHDHPERLRSLAVINCPHPRVFVDVLRRDRQQRARSRYMLLAQLPWYPERKIARNAAAYITRIMRDSAAEPERIAVDELQPYIEQARTTGLRGGLNYYRALLRSRPPSRGPVRVPTLLLWGGQDPVLGRQLAAPERYSGLVDQLDVRIIEDAAHWVQVEASQRVNTLLQEHWSRHE